MTKIELSNFSPARIKHYFPILEGNCIISTFLFGANSQVQGAERPE